MSETLASHLTALKPEIWLTGTILVMLVLDLLVGKRSARTVGVFGLIGIGGAMWALMNQSSVPVRAFGLISIDTYSIFFRALIISATGIVMLHGMVFRGIEDETRAEFGPMLVGAALGACLLVSTDNLIMLLVGMELLSLCSYVMAGWQKKERRSAEAGLKYLVYGAMASGLMLFGFSLLYGLSGSMWMPEIALAVSEAWSLGDAGQHMIVVIASTLVFVGFGFKISAFPFHFWAPDVYEGSPTPVTSMLAVASKTAGFGVLIRFVDTVYLDLTIAEDWLGRFGYVIAVLAAITMTYGNVTAVKQNNIKRLLAYSSIAHAGYLLMGVAVMTTATVDNRAAVGIGMESILFYLVSYYIATLGAFGCAMAFANRFGAETLEDYEGLGWSSPWIGACFIIFLTSLVGLPPAIGLIGKWLLFKATLSVGLDWLAVIAALNAAVALFYYFKIARALFLRGDTDYQEGLASKGVIPGLAHLSLIVLAIFTVYFGLMWDGIMEWVSEAVM